MVCSIIILAAGQGKRMRSAQPKVLHELAGRPLLAHVCATAHALEPRSVHVVYGHGGNAVPETLQHLQVSWVEQAEQLGTGHAVAQALPAIPDDEIVLILYGDVPLITSATLQRLLQASGDGVGLLTARLDDPTGYGRILRDAQGRVSAIVEEKDADASQRAVCEINTGFMAVRADRLKAWVAALDNRNAQGEYYLTDIIALAVAAGVAVNTVQADCAAEVLGINDRAQLAAIERIYQARQAAAVMAAGVTLLDPARFDLRGSLETGTDVSIDINAVLEGEVYLGDGVRVGPNNFLRNVRIEAGTEVLSNCHIEDAVIGANSRIGPFARIRPESRLASNVHIGNFVEVKKSDVGAGSKINHLSYVGDTSVGSRVNIGAGTITCNYDGANKHRTIIEDDVFIGSDTQLVAPVTVGRGATLGAGTTLTHDAPPGELTLSRAKQETRKGWKRPVKK